MSFFSTPDFFMAIAFVIFIVLFGKKIYKALSMFLQGKIDEIENTIDESDSSHIEATNLLNAKRQDLLNIQAENSNFLAKNNKNYELALQNANQELEESVDFTKKQKSQLLKQKSENFHKQMSQATLSSAFNVAKNASLNGISKDQHIELIKQSSKRLASALNKKPS